LPSPLAPGVVTPSVEPAGEPKAPGTVKVELPWLVPAIGLGLGLLLLVKLMLDYAGTALLRIPRGPQTAAKLAQGFSAGTHNPPKGSTNLPGDGGTPEKVYEVEVTLLEEQAVQGDADVTLKGSKIGEN
jgi:hypothetical protein